MRMLKITAEGEVSVVEVPSKEPMDEVYKHIAPESKIIQYLPVFGSEGSLDILTDEEGRFAKSTRINALATLLAGYHFVRQHIVGDVLITVPDMRTGEWVDCDDLPQRVLVALGSILKGAMFA